MFGTIKRGLCALFVSKNTILVNIVKLNNLDLITVKSFINPMDAHMLKTKIQNAGFECQLIDEKTIDADPLVAQAVGGIKVRVQKKDHRAVLDLMDTIVDLVTLTPKGHVVICSNCQSKQVASAVYDEDGVESLFKGITRAFKMLNPKYTDNTYLCLKCNQKFKF